MAYLDGQAVFGIAVQCLGPNINPRRDQKANYPALNGTESLDMGDQGAFTTVTGRLYGATGADLADAIGALLSFYDGGAHVLTDSLGIDWPNCKLENLEFEGKGELDPDMGYTRRYTARFFHLTLG